MKRVVVFFPSWRYFGHFALPLFEPLATQYEIIFLHTEKAIYGWNDCPDLSEKGVETVDLQSLETFSFVKALMKLHADLVVVFDKGWVQDRALLHATKHLKIPSLQIQHGIIARLDGVETKNRFQRAFNEFVKIMRTFRLYNSSLMNIGFGAWMKSLSFQFRLLLNPNDYYYNHRDETVTDLACIIGERDRDFFVEKEGYYAEQLVPMGAIQFQKAYAMKPQEPEQRILLISQPLFEDHLLEGGLAAKKEHIRAITEASPLPVAIKPHPREDRQWYLDYFSSSELLVYSADKDINEAIQECSHVIGYFSTALINALILKRPVGIIRWVDDQAYVLNLDKDGAAVTLMNPAGLSALTAAVVPVADPIRYAFNEEVGAVLNATLVRLLKG
ncbi:polysialyltransferase family glycosyltransferase [Pontiellaceae bacterium B1224]|nr:polysialyltransferase family glycosyltransferase [Pontiellaceae bacterium B1224]